MKKSMVIKCGKKEKCKIEVTNNFCYVMVVNAIYMIIGNALSLKTDSVKKIFNRKKLAVLDPGVIVRLIRESYGFEMLSVITGKKVNDLKKYFHNNNLDITKPDDVKLFMTSYTG